MSVNPPFDLPVDNPAVPEVFADGFIVAAGPEAVRIAFHASQPALNGKPERPRISQKLVMTSATFRNLLAIAAASANDAGHSTDGASIQ